MHYPNDKYRNEVKMRKLEINHLIITGINYIIILHTKLPNMKMPGFEEFVCGAGGNRTREEFLPRAFQARAIATEQSFQI